MNWDLPIYGMQKVWSAKKAESQCLTSQTFEISASSGNFAFYESLEEKTAAVSGRQSSGQGALGGEGEKEQNLLMDQVKALEAKLKNLIQRERAKQSQRFEGYEENRDYRKEPRVALVDQVNSQIGYTNAGKSALLNSLTNKEQVESNNRLFETLKTTSRNFEICQNLKGVVIDTIGFIDNLPTELVDSFSSTLNEIETADIVIMVEDISHPQVEQQRKVAESLLNRLALDYFLAPERLVRVWNKIDLCTDDRLKRLIEKETQKSDIVMTNLKDGVGVEDLKSKIKEKIDGLFQRKLRTLKFLYSEQDQRAKWLKE